jgi:hypothetical protein
MFRNMTGATLPNQNPWECQALPTLNRLFGFILCDFFLWGTLQGTDTSMLNVLRADAGTVLV